MIKKAYILGVQDALRDADVVKYANEEAAQADASMLAGEMEQQPIDEAAMATEGVAPEATAQIATAVVQMAQEAGATAEEAKAKADIAAQAASELANSGAMKTAEAPADNNVVAGTGSAGSIAAGEGVAKATDQNKELETAVDNTAERADVHGAPGHQADENKGTIGTEAGDAPAAAPVAKGTDLNKELVTAVPNTSERENVHGAPGHQADENKGTIGTEEKQSSLLERLARL